MVGWRPDVVCRNLAKAVEATHIHEAVVDSLRVKLKQSDKALSGNSPHALSENPNQQHVGIDEAALSRTLVDLERLQEIDAEQDGKRVMDLPDHPAYSRPSGHRTIRMGHRPHHKLHTGEEMSSPSLPPGDMRS